MQAWMMRLPESTDHLYSCVPQIPKWFGFEIHVLIQGTQAGTLNSHLWPWVHLLPQNKTGCFCKKSREGTFYDPLIEFCLLNLHSLYA